MAPQAVIHGVDTSSITCIGPSHVRLIGDLPVPCPRTPAQYTGVFAFGALTSPASSADLAGPFGVPPTVRSPKGGNGGDCSSSVGTIDKWSGVPVPRCRGKHAPARSMVSIGDWYHAIIASMGAVIS